MAMADLRGHARGDRPAASTIQFTPDAVSVVRSSDDFGPTTTCRSAGLSASTYSGAPVGRREAEPLALADGEAVDAVVAPSDAAALVDDRAARAPRPARAASTNAA